MLLIYYYLSILVSAKQFEGEFDLKYTDTVILTMILVGYNIIIYSSSVCNV